MQRLLHHLPVAPGRAFLAGGLLAAVVLAVACGDGEHRGPDDGRAPGPDREASAPPDELRSLWSLDVQAVSRPVAVGNHVVLSVFEGDGVALVAYDAASGTERWRRPSAAPGPRPLTDGELVFHLTPVDGDSFNGEHIEAVAVATGETAWRTEQAAVANHPVELCTTAASHICLQVTSWPEASTSIWVVATADGTIDENGFMRLGLYSGGENSDLRMSWVRRFGRSDGPTEVTYIDHGAQVWQRPETDVAGDPDAVGMMEWFGYDAGLVGVLPRAAGPSTADGREVLEPNESVGLDPRSGERLWSEPFDGDCGELSRLGLEPLDRPTTGWGSVTHPERLVLCALTGRVEWAAGEPVSSQDVRLTIAELDPRNGKVLTSVNVENAGALLDPRGPLVRLGPAAVASVFDDGTPFVLDLDDGEIREPGAGDTGWCFSTNTYGDVREAAARGASQDSVRGADFTTPCDAEGRPRPLPGAVDADIGAVIGDIFVWMDTDGVHAAQVPS